MTDFWLIRHGSTDTLNHGIAGWQPGVHLNPIGQQEVRALALRTADCGATSIYCSPLERTKTTAQLVAAKLGCPVIEDRELGELDFGDWTGLGFGDLHGDPLWQRWNTFRSGTRIPRGELMVEVQVRAVQVLLRLRDDRPNQRVLIVSHGDVIKALVTYFLGMPLDFYPRLEVAPASITQLEVGHEHARLIRLNDCAHLEEARIP